MTAYDRPTTITDTGSIQAEDAKDGCPRCGGKVIFRFLQAIPILVLHTMNTFYMMAGR